MPVTYPSRVTLKGVRIDLLILNSLELLFPAPAVYIIVSVPTLQWALSLPSNKWACNHSIATESCLDKPAPTLPATYCGCQLTLTQMRSTDPDVRNFLSHENRAIEKWFSKLKGKKASKEVRQNPIPCLTCKSNCRSSHQGNRHYQLPNTGTSSDIWRLDKWQVMFQQ